MARPPDPRVTAAAHDAVLSLTNEGGVERLSMELVAKRSGVNKSTLYRRWGSLEQLLTEAIDKFAERAIPAPRTGSVRTDLQVLCRAARDLMAERESRALFALAMHQQQTNSFAQAWWNARLEVMTAILEDSHPATDPALVLERLAGPIILRSNVLGQPMSDAELDKLVDDVLQAVA